MAWWRKDDDASIAGLPALGATPARAATVPSGTGVEVVVTRSGADHKINLIKLHREHTGTGLKEAKDAVEFPPTSFGRHDAATAAALRDELVSLGATVELRGPEKGRATKGGEDVRLDYLAELLDRGLVTPDGYAAERARLRAAG